MTEKPGLGSTDHALARGEPDGAANRTKAKAAPKSAARKPALTFWQRVMRKKVAVVDTLPHATFSHTPMGIRSLVSAGIGAPTVVFEAGLGNGKRTWESVFNSISAITRAVAYDRAGYGQSEPSQEQRDGLQIVIELRALLQTEGIAPPYVLVGHSLGGTYMKLYAKTYPDEVVGVVLVDARHAEFTQRCRQLGVPRLLYDPPPALLKMLPPTTRAELLGAALTLKQTRRAGPFPPVPLIVLTQSKAAAKWPLGLGRVWLASQRNLVKMSNLGRLKVASESGHNVHKDRPEVVVRAVVNVVRAARYLAAKSAKEKRRAQKAARTAPLG